MSHAATVQPQHLQRTAVVYVRQSTAKQLLLHQESTRRQYQLADRAAALGWPQPRIVVIDDDLGQSGTSSTQRLGFQRLVTAITLGEVGLVLVTEVSRLSRLNSDWHRVLELCAVFGTLIADDEGVYDPQDPGDRLVLGLKGTLFAAELHILRARMRQGLLHKAQRGALALRLPVGYRRLHDGSVVLDPDEQVRQTLGSIFEQFARLKNARAVQRYFQLHELLMPRYVQAGLDYGRVVWVRPTYQMFQQVLTSPVYAGIFVYGRRIQQTTPGDPPRTLLHRLPQDKWEIVVPGVYPAYIGEEQYYANRETLRRNLFNFAQRRPGAPREGPALLQGLLLCGRCGRRMTISYGSDYAAYLCRRDKATYDAPQCQSFPRAYLDEAIRDLFLAAIQPAELDTLLGALAALEQERQQADRQWQLRRERARYAVRLAERQYDACDPENRLVARELERRWNDALAAHQTLEREYAAACRTTLAPLNAAEQQAIRQLAADLPALWEAPTTGAADRKRLLRLVLQEVTVLVHPGPPRYADLTLRWSGGQTTAATVTCRTPGWHCMTSEATLARLRALAPTLPDHQIAARLNAEQVPTATGKLWTAKRVRSMRIEHGIASGCPVDPTGHPCRGDGLVSVCRAAHLLGVSPALIHVWIGHGVLAGDQRVAGSYRWVRLTEDDQRRLQGEAPCTQLPSLREVARERGCAAEAVWDLVRAGEFVPYRHRAGQQWEWRLQRQQPERAARTLLLEAR
jgi:DNA invertase Pin-like site-specific DNA recombinase